MLILLPKRPSLAYPESIPIGAYTTYPLRIEMSENHDECSIFDAS